MKVKVAYLGVHDVQVVHGLCVNAAYDTNTEKHYIEIQDIRTNVLHKIYMSNIIKWDDFPDPQ